jgi:hypothetical protein
MEPTLKSACYLIAAIALVLGMVAFAATRPKLPISGVVPDEQTAVKVADAIFRPVFGATEVEKWRPYHAQLDKSGFWTVYGTLPRGMKGGTPMLKINRRNGRVLEVWHSL